MRTNFRYALGGCWERLPDSPTTLGFRGTALALNSSLWVFGGGDANREATSRAFQLSLPDHEWTEVVTNGGPTPRYKHAAIKLSRNSALIVGGRTFGTDVESDAWIWDGRNWTLVSSSLLGEGIYRHAMTLVENRTLWIFGGIDDSLQRHDRMWKVDIETWEAVRIDTPAPPNRRASHALEYVASLQALVAYGGTCSDDSTLWLFDLNTESWCAIDAARPPSLRDAFLWTLVDTTFYVVGGDVICVEPGQVYSIIDVHSIDLSPTSSYEWNLEYEPRNERDESIVALCDGANRGSCRAPPLLDDPPDEPLNSCLNSTWWRDSQTDDVDNNDKDSSMSSHSPFAAGIAAVLAASTFLLISR